MHIYLAVNQFMVKLDLQCRLPLQLWVRIPLMEW